MEPPVVQAQKGKGFPETHEVYPDEWAVELAEFYRPTPDSKATHRYQFIVVIRRDALCVYKEDMGDQSLFHQDELYVPGGALFLDANGDFRKFNHEHTVAELKEIAEEWRFCFKADHFDREPRDLIQGYYDLSERRYRKVKGIQTFGMGDSDGTQTARP